MKPFIGELADALLERHGDNLDDVCVVFPSRRACVFFKDYLVKRIDRAMWAPAVYAIEDLVRELQPVIVIESLSLTFELYPIYREIFPNEPFDKFYSWGKMLVSDFDEIDRNLVDAQAIFQNLYELKEIDTSIDSWLNEDGQPTDYQVRYLRFWELLGDFYLRLRKKLEAGNKASPGQAMRALAEEYARKKPKLPWQEIAFAGFNALSPAEELLIRSLMEHDLATCYWDLDHYYVDDPFQEAGRFFRDLRQRWEKADVSFRGNWNWIGNALQEHPKTVRITGVPQRVGQAKVAGIRLRELLAQELPHEEIAVVLPDENLLFPLLHSLPQELRDVNVTMGYPLRHTPLFSLVEAIIQLHENADRLRPASAPIRYYFRDVQNLLRHPYIHALVFDDSRKLLQEISADNLVYLRPDFFQNNYDADHFFRFLFHPWESIPQVINYYLDLYRKLKAAFERPSENRRSAPTIEAEYLYRFFTMTQRLRDRLEDYNLNFDLKIFRRLYKEVIINESIPFTGEPLRGLQVMGMLETRGLDFRHLIILSVNEGILPSKPTVNSFIPYNLRQAFGLPTHEEKDAIYAYHFYRLLQRAENITLIYNTENDTFGSGEKSRFIAQLESELPQRNQQATITSEMLTFPSQKEELVPISVEKTPDLIEKLREFATEKGFSPSTLATYLNCSLQFYYRQLLRLKEKEEPEETMEQHTFGKVLHKVMEDLYQDWTGKMVSATDIEAMHPKVDPFVEQAFQNITKTDNFRFGKNKLLLGVIRDLILLLLERDRESAPLRIEGLELEIETELTTMRQPEGIKLKGFLDRVDQVGGEVRIVDYKTGRVPRRLEVKDFEEIRDGTKKKEVFQLAFYAYLYLRNAAKDTVVRSGIYPVRNLSQGLKFLSIGPQAEHLDLIALEDFEAELVNILDEIFDPAVPFTQTDEPTRCRYCAYKVICVRS
ncbi:MAG: PD-(D/E)XK nuclease family protein [Bacteroidota bacterium]